MAIVEGQICTIDKRGEFLTIRPSDQRTVGRMRSTVKGPRAVAWDGSALWIAGDEANTIYRVDSRTGRVLKTLRIPAEKTSSPSAIEAVAWDGKFLWAAVSAGWSSRILRLDAESGQVVQSLFADGIPGGLASDGRYLWIATNNGKNPSLLARWTIGDDAEEMLRTRVFIARLPGTDPSGLAHDGKALWYADRKETAFRRLELPENR